MRYVLLLALLTAVCSATASGSGNYTYGCWAGSCDDGLLCNGIETCNRDSHCVPELNPHVCGQSSDKCAPSACDSVTQRCESYQPQGLDDPCGLTNTGSCRIGSMTCDPGSGALNCSGRIDPVREGTVADGIDNDCDGIVDNEAAVQACTTSSNCQPSTDCVLSQCVSGYCQYSPRNVGNVCRGNGPESLSPYVCSAAGQCLSQSGTACSGQARNPAVSNVCTVVRSINGRCSLLPWTGPCNDGDSCTVNDACSSEANTQPTCRGTPINCDDQEACTNDMCADGTCIHEPIEGCVRQQRLAPTTTQDQSIGSVSPDSVSTTNASTTPVPTITESDNPSDSKVLAVIVMVPVILLALLIIVIIAFCIIRQGAENELYDRKRQS